MDNKEIVNFKAEIKSVNIPSSHERLTNILKKFKCMYRFKIFEVWRTIHAKLLNNCVSYTFPNYNKPRSYNRLWKMNTFLKISIC